MDEIREYILWYAEKYPEWIRTTRDKLKYCPIVDISGEDLKEGDTFKAGWLKVTVGKDGVSIGAEENTTPFNRYGFIVSGENQGLGDITMIPWHCEGRTKFITIVNQSGCSS